MAPQLPQRPLAGARPGCLANGLLPTAGQGCGSCRLLVRAAVAAGTAPGAEPELVVRDGGNQKIRPNDLSPALEAGRSRERPSHLSGMIPFPQAGHWIRKDHI